MKEESEDKKEERTSRKSGRDKEKTSEIEEG
jgi:hypothetical protein